MQNAKPILLRVGAAIILAACAGAILSATGANAGAVAFNSFMFGAAIFYCGSVVAGHNALLKIVLGLSGLMLLLSATGYAVTLAIAGVGNWMSASFVTVILAVTIILRPTILTRLKLQRVVA